jgi:hypothetical protein
VVDSLSDEKVGPVHKLIGSAYHLIRSSAMASPSRIALQPESVDTSICILHPFANIAIKAGVTQW